MAYTLTITPIPAYTMMDECSSLALQGAEVQAQGLRLDYYRVHGTITDYWYCAHMPEHTTAVVSFVGALAVYGTVPTIESVVYRYFGADTQITKALVST